MKYDAKVYKNRSLKKINETKIKSAYRKLAIFVIIKCLAMHGHEKYTFYFYHVCIFNITASDLVMYSYDCK